MSYLPETDLFTGQELRILSTDEDSTPPEDDRIFIGIKGWFLLFAAVQAFNTIFFIVGYFCLHISIIDVSWFLMPLVPLTMLLVERGVVLGAESITPIMVVVYILIAVWGLRLAWHIASRYQGPDQRYVELEKFDAGCPQPGRGIAIWIKIFVFQATCSVVMTDPAIKIFQYSEKGDTLGAFEIAGIAIWIFGYIFESIGDWQLKQYLQDPNKVPGEVINTGLWRYTRHPNYFGECLLWYGLYLMACGGSTGPAGGYYTFYSPLLMNFMLRYFSGVLILEAKQKRKPAFRVYMLETNCFIPWFYKKIEGKEREDLIEEFKIKIEQEKKEQKGSIMWGLWKKEWNKLLIGGGPKEEEEPVETKQEAGSFAIDTEKEMVKQKNNLKNESFPNVLEAHQEHPSAN